MATIGLVPGRGGLGMAAASLARAGRPARVTGALYCPPAVRDDPALAAAVQTDVDAWAAGVGLAAGPAAGLGRLVVLAHPDTGDTRRLGVAARLLALGRVLAAGALGAETEDLPASVALPRDVLAQALDEAIAEVYDGCDLPEQPEPAGRSGSSGQVLTAGSGPVQLSALAGLSALPASPYQIERVRRECQTLASAPHGTSGLTSAWETLSLGHVNAYSPALAALDAIDGFELSPRAAADPELRRARRLASLAAALLHDIADPAPAGLTAAIARTDGLGAGAAARRAAQIHDEAMRAFQHHAAELASRADPATRRYLAGLWTWLGGHRTWHAVTDTAAAQHRHSGGTVAAPSPRPSLKPSPMTVTEAAT